MIELLGLAVAVAVIVACFAVEAYATAGRHIITIKNVSEGKEE